MRGWATRRHPFVRLDCTAPGKAMVELARRWDDAIILEAAIDLAAYLRGRPELDGVYATWEHSPLQHPWGPATLAPAEVALLAAPPAGVFVDCLHFDPPFFTALGRLTGDADLIADGVRQALGYVRLLATPPTACSSTSCSTVPPPPTGRAGAAARAGRCSACSTCST